mgnify:CR=1 FL=1|tara:strand:+ start:495 stop:854 length:360 start_codon:yes stop_codon:yes gene_type:complete
MKEIITKITENKLLLTLSEKIYEREAVSSAAYKFTDLCTILIEPAEDNCVEVYFESKENQSTEELDKIAKDFCNEVLDQQVRLDIEARAGNIREVIVQHAFSPLKDIKNAVKLPSKKHR